ncbi:MAG: GTPase Era [Spirochaetia bacterium]|jgi:GTP-binding protein Era|nr:GTPase Era [Spirochaetales bacterium]MDX9784867.1 GTPase Era [Spirochaetia bacterium]
MSKSAFAAIVGRPSAGKSTLLNALCGAKVSIVSPVPQTTRNTVRGIVNRTGGQIVFLDTPGFHISEKRFNLKLRDLVTRALADADLVVYLVDATREPGPEEEAMAAALKGIGRPLVAALNKIDHAEAVPDRAAAFVTLKLPKAVLISISALEGKGLDELMERLIELAPEGPAWYPKEYYTDQEPVFRIAEIVREKILRHTRQELPHAVFVDYSDSRRLGDGSLEASYDIVVERSSQKGILIGKAGSMIQKIRQESEAELEELFEYPIHLRLQVRVDPDWRRDEKRLEKLIY